MRALLPTASDDMDLHAWYAQQWLEYGGMRVNLVTSADGAATQDGLSNGLQTTGDNRVFAALRDLADVVVAGTGTIRAEGYRPIDVSPARREIRRAYGLAETLPTAVISQSLNLDPHSELFSAAPASTRTIVITVATAPPEALRELREVAEVILAGDVTVDLIAAKAALAARGLSRILCEGGPTLFASVAHAGAVDELCLSISPLLTGPGAPRIAGGPTWDTGPRTLVLAGLLEENGALFCRYRIAH